MERLQKSVQEGTTKDARQHMLYYNWVELCSTLWVSPTIQDSSLPRFEILQVYGNRVQNSHYFKRRLERFGKEPVSQTWGEIAEIHILDGLPNSRKSPESQYHTIMDRLLTRQVKT